MTNPYTPVDVELSNASKQAARQCADEVAYRFRWTVIPALACYLYAAVLVLLVAMCVYELNRLATSTADHPFRTAEILYVVFVGTCSLVAIACALWSARQWMARRYLSAAIVSSGAVMLSYLCNPTNSAVYGFWQSLAIYLEWHSA